VNFCRSGPVNPEVVLDVAPQPNTANESTAPLLVSTCCFMNDFQRSRRFHFSEVILISKENSGGVCILILVFFWVFCRKGILQRIVHLVKILQGLNFLLARA
jgi:hypothetical protein